MFFVSYQRNETKQIETQGNILDVPLNAQWICPGFLNSEDLEQLRENGDIAVKKNGEKIKGLYNDLGFEIPMYTDNYVIYSGLLRKF